ncbi:dynein axonemal heavy chain 7 [Phlebotomus argentipes]|uniref:dynein axonemal heavy chain 7 n=1 Tax=Phlebotomus argentipes TaxID=94469 RepID=UPI002893520F|nr:dynein axonemal heavy chain 7 [Phlebotomus argentipes]
MSKYLSKLIKPPSDYERYENDAFSQHPLMRFRLSNIRERRHFSLLKHRAALGKIRVCRTIPEDLSDVLPQRQDRLRQKLFMYANKAPIPKILHRTERKIIEYVPGRLRNRYPDAVEDYMKEVREDYDKIIRAFSLQKLLVPKEGEFVPPREDFRLKAKGRTRNYRQFLENRRRIGRNLLITAPYIRCIVHFSSLDFPDVLNDLSRYRKLGEIILDELENKARKDLYTNAEFLKKSWYPKIVRVMVKYYKKKAISRVDLPKILECASTLINRQITELKIRTLNNICEVIEDREKIPYLKVSLICEKQIDLYPTLEKIFKVYHDMMDDVAEIANNLTSLELLVDPEMFKTHDEHLKIAVGEIYMKEAHERLNRVLENAYSPVILYLSAFQEEYKFLSSPATQISIEEFLTISHTFDEYLTKIDEIQVFIDKLRRCIQREFFDFMTLNQFEAIQSLREIADILVDRITDHIVSSHRQMCDDICSTFVEIKRKALEIPKSTESLLESAEYMNYVKSQQMKELQDRIEECLKIGGTLLEFKELSKEHLQAQISTINWYNNIDDVFEQNAQLQELYKFQFEEHLQNVAKKLNEDIAEMLPTLSIIDDMCETDKFREYYGLLQNIIDNLRVFENYVEWLNKEEKLFKFPKSTYPVLEAIKNFVIPFAKLMKLCIEWLRHFYVWMDGPFEYLEPNFVAQTVDEYLKEFQETQKYYHNRIKADLIGNPICKFRGQTEDPSVEKHPVPLKLCWKMINWIQDFRLGVQIVKIICNPALRERHWNEMSQMVGFDLTPDAGTTLRKFIDYKLEEKLADFEIISIGANKELLLQENLTTMIEEWNGVQFQTGQLRNTSLMIFKGVEDIQGLLGDHINKTLAMRGSAFVKPCEAEVKQWYSKLVRVNSTIEQWLRVQMLWLYFLPIFSSPDIVAQMIKEGDLFREVDATYHKYMAIIAEDAEVMRIAPLPGLLEDMQAANDKLDTITCGVNGYLDRKRLFFSRFFFLSNDEMLEILSETKDPVKVDSHLLAKCFDGIHKLSFDDDLNILGICSDRGEKITLLSSISTQDARGSVEKWLSGVEREMIRAVKDEIFRANQDYSAINHKEWILKWPQMVVLCCQKIHWTLDVELCLRGGNSFANLRKKFTELEMELKEIVDMMRSSELTNLHWTSLRSLIVMNVHSMNIVKELLEKKTTTSDEFIWLAQLRYYIISQEVSLNIINANISFGYEYLGNHDRLVITPLTDRCHRTMIAGHQLHLFGAPEGPAGSGKTETCKDLAKALAIQCKIFNCSDSLDFTIVGKFLKGAASGGAWICFDEFNRMQLEVLSVVAQQIYTIIQAIRANLIKFLFDGLELPLKASCYVCVTMNPGYVGRSELPDNIKTLFRTVAMMVPDYRIIGEISLYSFGFQEAGKLARKIVTIYRLCSEQLSSQHHYDYGMRTIKSVIVACGTLKKLLPDEDEEILLYRALSDVNLPKFVSHDIPLFENIMKDLFPGRIVPAKDQQEFEETFTAVCHEKNLQMTNNFLMKALQIYHMMLVRHGLMILGESFAGKTTCLRVLADTLRKILPNHQSVSIAILNPKCVTISELYGTFNGVTNEWTDGIISKIFRQFSQDTSTDWKWVIFDGPVDAVWIENLNTVLDDNRKLCLTSGEVIKMPTNLVMIFEVMTLEHVSPASVSRCGMIFMDPRELGWKTLAKSWINQCNPLWMDGNRDLIMDLFSWIFPPCLKFLSRHCTQFLHPGEMNLVMSTLNLFEMFINEACDDNTEEFAKNLSTWFQAATVMAIFWGLAGILDGISRAKFDGFFREIWRNDEEIPLPESVGRIEVTLPTEGLLVEYCYHFKQKGMWKYWPDIVRRMEHEVTPLGIQVPTIDTARYSYLFELLIKHKKPFLLTGPTGTGKSFFIQNFLMSKVSQEVFTPSFVTFTVMISAKHTQELILAKLVKKRRWQYGATRGKTAIIFVDDMNMPEKDEFDAQPPLELLRQFFDHSFWHSEANPINLKDILLICSCGPPGGSRQVVYPRVLRHFNIFSINNFSDESLSRIFSALLLNGLKARGHASDVISAVNPTVAATLNLYRTASKSLRPTPQKSHYIFNLRDISRVISGCALLRKESVDNKKMFPKIWLHETMRTFCDRLTDSTDREWFFNEISTSVEEYFGEKISTIFEEYKQEDKDILYLDDLKNFMFGSYLDLATCPDERKYEEIPDLAALKDLALASLEEYNANHTAKLDIVLFGYALEHLNKICRILTVPAGSCLLVGIGGSGRQSLSRVAAGICQQSVFQPEITKEYGLEEWRRNLKEVLREAGGLGKDTVFLFSDSQVNLEVFLQDIDCLLNLGEVPNIYGIDERQEILEMVRLDAQGGNRNIDISPLQVFTFFVNRCKQRLHIILCFSPIGDSLRSRIRLYPSLVNCCTIDWYEEWPPEALEMIARRYMKSIDIPTPIRESAMVACKNFHNTAIQLSGQFFKETSRTIHVTSACYLELVRSFRNLMEKKQQEIQESTKRYEAGLETLVQASSTVAIMQRDLNELQPKLIVMAANSREMMKQIEKKTIEASEASEHVKKDEVNANAQAAVAQELKDECEKDLAQAIPILEEAIQALNTLKPADITLVKSMKNPPEVVKLVMAAVCVIKGVPPDRINDPATGKKIIDYWGPSKRILGDMGFLQSLKDFDKDNIGVDIMKKIRKDFIPHKDFQPHIVLKASSAAEGLCKWIIAMDLYDSVAKIVAPKKTRLEAAEKEYAATLKILNEKRQMAEELERKVGLLNEELTEANREMQRVEAEVEVCKNKLQRAESLIASLGGEKNRWTLAVEHLQKLYNNLAGDILMSCGFIAYLAPFSIAYRKRAVKEWHALCIELRIPSSIPFRFTDVLGSDLKLQNWSIAGLPKDAFSAENATVLDNSSRYSLFIDPQSQANNWIKTLEKPNGLRVVKFSHSNYMKILAECIQQGIPCLIESITNDLEVQLNPILFRHTFIKNEMEFITFGGETIEFSSNFRLYLTSNARNPHYLPEVVNKVTIINFSLTLQGLEDQLLGIVVAKERPDLQELRQKLILESAENQKVLKEVEDGILKTLSTSKGDILEDERAIKILDDSKVLSVKIKSKQLTSKKTEKEIEDFRFSYRAVASHSSVLYYCITDLPNIDPMYQFSLQWYINLYIFSIENANKSKDIFRRLKFLMDTITLNLYTNVCRSIFEKDKLLFSFILTTKIMIMCHQIRQEQYTHLLRGGKSLKESLQNPAPTWINDKMWAHLQQLEQMEEFQGFIEDFHTNLPEWKTYYDIKEPQIAPFPPSWGNKINRFEKLLVLNALRPDKTAAAIQKFVACEMGPLYVRPPAFDITKSFEDANCLMPLIFILSPGADPIGALTLHAEKMGFSKAFETVSMGKGQGPIAERLIKSAQKAGTWVCLQNCHLATSWLPTLEQIWEDMDVHNTALTFRLWLTSYPVENFPPALLQCGVKMTNEPPTGLKQNLLRSYNSEPMNNEQFYTGCPDKYKAFTKLLYGLCFFHAVVQERRKFSAMGWNIAYPFNETDFQISVRQLQRFINEFAEIPFETVAYLTAECNYGGRVTDVWDRRVIGTLLQDYFNENVVTDVTYKFSDTSSAFAIPTKFEHRDIVKHIERNIPSNPSTEVYGLHMNAGIFKDLTMSKVLLKCLTLTLGTADDETLEESQENLLLIIMEIEKKLPGNFDLENIGERFPIDYYESMNTVLMQELEKFNVLLEEIRTTCREIVDAIGGFGVFTPHLESVALSIKNGEIPQRWRKKSFPSLKPVGSYIEDLLERISWFDSWSKNGIPDTFWLPGFFFTQTFLTGILQNHARRHQIPIDELTFDHRILNGEDNLADGVKISGLFLEGAKWNAVTHQLDEQSPKILIHPMPKIYLQPLLHGNLKVEERYECPTYRTMDRKGDLSTAGHSTNFILSILLPSDKKPSHWIKRSVALVCQTSD